jgi:hypothetical protein
VHLEWSVLADCCGNDPCECAHFHMSHVILTPELDYQTC